MSRPTYQLGFHGDTWKLIHQHSSDVTLELRIKYGFHGDSHHDITKQEDWNRYQFKVWTDGDDYVLLTGEDWAAYVEAVRDNEGEEVLLAWLAKNEFQTPEVHGGVNFYFLNEFRKMVAHWEALLALGLFVPQINDSNTWG